VAGKPYLNIEQSIVNVDNFFPKQEEGVSFTQTNIHNVQNKNKVSASAAWCLDGMQMW
jgi:hypothetical protein